MTPNIEAWDLAILTRNATYLNSFIITAAVILLAWLGWRLFVFLGVLLFVGLLALGMYELWIIA